MEILKKSTEIKTRGLEELLLLTTELKKYETDRTENYEDLSDLALKTTKNIFEPFRDYFKAKNIVVTYHGSLLYHDPRNLDCDIVLFSHNSTIPIKVFDILEQNILDTSDWPLPNPNPDISSFTIIQAQSEANLFNNGEKYDDYFSPMYISMLFTSGVLYSEQKSDLIRLQMDAVNILINCPTLLEQTIKETQECIEKRISRRNN